MGLQSTALPGNVNGDSCPVFSRMVLFLQEWLAASPIQPQENLQGAYIGREDQLVPAESLFQFRSMRRRSSRHHRRHRQSRKRRHSVRDSGSSEELDIESVRLDPTQYLTRNYAFSDNTDNIPSSCLMMRKLPRVPCLVVLHVPFLIFYLFLFDDNKNQSPSFQHKAQVSALIESMHEPLHSLRIWLRGLCQLIYLMTLSVQPWARISDLRMEFKNSKLLKRLVNAFNAVKTEQTHWNRACSMIGSGFSLLTEDTLNQCALRLGWQPTWMTESQNNTRRANVPATEHEAMRAFVNPYPFQVGAGFENVSYIFWTFDTLKM